MIRGKALTLGVAKIQRGVQISQLERIESVQFLRFIAALLVAAYHLPLPSADRAGVLPTLREVFEWGAFGVDVFFVISGFIIVLTASRREIFDWRAFLIDRADRIYPIYYVVLAMVVGISLIQTMLGIENATSELLTPIGWVTSLLLLPLPFQIMPVAWTLGMELTFYFIFALTFHKWRVLGVSVALLGWYSLSLIYLQFLVLDESKLLVFLLHSVCLEFLFGVGIAALYLRRWMPLGLPVLILGIASVVTVSSGWIDTPLSDYRREFSWGIPAAMIVYGSVALSYRVPRWTILAGEASYALYLSHGIGIAVMRKVSPVLFDMQLGDSVALQIVTLVGCTLGSIMILFLIERPLRGVLKRSKRSYMSDMS